MNPVGSIGLEQKRGTEIMAPRKSRKTEGSKPKLEAMDREHVAATSADPAIAPRLEELKKLFPEAFSEGRVDLGKLRETLGDFADDRPERYSFTWAGKRNALRLLQTPSRATLTPSREESINFDSTQHLFIDGDNLEVLKLLYKSYAGRVKMIYIDPPYNTGKDFIYPDNFTDTLDAYLKLTGQKEGNGNLMTTNPETSGRFHSSWLSMMYPRLFVARQLLADDGVIFISIDDYEARNLRLILDEIFGEENFLAQLVWEKGRKNDAKLFSVGHEYMVVYARSKATLRALNVVWREEKPGAKEIWDEYLRLREKHKDNDAAIEADLSEWFKGLPKGHPSKKLSRYRRIDKYGPWRDRDISWPGGGGPTYHIIHPKTKQPCRVPPDGWRFAAPEEMERQIKLGLVVFREDHTEPPFRKAHLKPIPDELTADDEAEPFDDEANNGGEDEELAMQVMPSYIYKQSQVAIKYLKKLMNGKIFDNPKDHEVLARIIKYCTNPAGNEIVLDFFAGSGSTGQAVYQANLEQGGNRRVILVQLPEPTRRKQENGKYKETAAYRAGYRDIAALARGRLAEAIDEYKQQTDGQFDFDKQGEALGFRAFKLAESHYRRWTGTEHQDADELARQMEFFNDPLLPGWTPEGVIYEVLLKEGYSLTSRVEPLAVSGRRTRSTASPTMTGGNPS